MKKGPHLFPHDVTVPLHIAQKFTEENCRTKEGVICPCCQQFFKLYKKGLHAEMAWFLIQLTQKWKRHMRYYTTREMFPKDHKATTEGVLLRHWGLIEVLPAHNTANAPSGAFRPTDKGLQFVHGAITVPSHVHLLNNQCMGFSDKLVTIQQALGKKFDYEELMAG